MLMTLSKLKLWPTWILGKRLPLARVLGDQLRTSNEDQRPASKLLEIVLFISTGVVRASLPLHQNSSSLRYVQPHPMTSTPMACAALYARKQQSCTSYNMNPSFDNPSKLLKIPVVCVLLRNSFLLILWNWCCPVLS